MEYPFVKRLLSVLLVAVIVLGLVPAVATPETQAATAEEIAAQTASALGDLKGRYSNLQIPKTKAKYVTTGNVGSLAGTYFMVIYGAHHRMINYGVNSSTQYDRLNGNCYNKPPTEGGNHSYLPSLHINIGNWKTENGEFTGINGLTPDNLLDYAVEFRPNTVAVNYNETYVDDGIEGWTDYTKWEYERKTLATGGSLGFGPYMGVNGIMSKSDTAYNILSLHPTRTAAGNPWVGTYDSWGNAGYRPDAMPIFIKPNTDGRTFKMYKVDFQNYSNCYTYWFGVDEYYSNSPINAHTISQIVREDKNQNTKDYPGHNIYKYSTDWELFQVSPSTLELYKALYKAKSYVMQENASTTYSASLYLEFLQYAVSAMTEYNENRGTFNDNPTDAGRVKMDRMAATLYDYMTRLDSSATEKEQTYSALRDAIAGANWPYGERYSSLPSTLDGHWLIMGGESRGENGLLFSINPDSRGSWNDSIKDDPNGHRGSGTFGVGYYIANGTDWGAVNPPYNTILKLSGSPSSFTAQLADGRYWNLNRNSNGSSTWGNFDLGSATALSVTATDGSRFLVHTTSKNVYLYANGYTIRARYTNDGATQYKQYFFKITEELYNMRYTLEEARHYLVDNSTGVFDKYAYNTFLTAVEDALNYYKSHYYYLDSSFNASERANMNKMTQDIVDAMAMLAASDSEEFAVVLDYGKSTDLELKQVADSFRLGADKAVTYVGASLSGSTGSVSFSKPSGLILAGKATNLEAETHRFDMVSPTTLRFTPKAIMEGTQTLYAVFKVESTTDANYRTRYLTKAVTFMPATTTYYETDLDNGIHHIDRTDSLLVHFGADDDTTWGSPANITYKSKANGVLSGTITGNDPHIEMTNKPDSFHYIVKPGDVVKVRIKVASGTGTNLQVFFMTETNERPTGGISTADVSFTANGNWQTITLPIFDAVIGKTIQALRIDPVSYYSKSGDFEVDWIYIGPDEELEPYIVMGFGTNDYTSWYQFGTVSNVTKDTSDGGYLKGDITGNDPYMTMTPESRRFGYRAKKDDVFRVRIQSSVGTGNGFEVYFLTDLNEGATETYVIRTDNYIPDGTWQIVEIPLTGNIIGREIRGVRLDPSSVRETYKNSGTFSIDWVYIGPKEEEKKPIVIEFDDSDGIEWYGIADVNNLTKANGVLKGTITGNDPRMQMTNASSTLNYTLKDRDVVKLRIRSDIGTGQGLDVFFLTDGNASPSPSCLARCGEYVPNGQWQTITMQIQHCAVGTTISGLRLDPTYNDEENEYAEGGTFEYDWVYIGPDIDLDTFGNSSFAYTTASGSSAWEYKGNPDANTANAQLSNSANSDPIYPGNSLFFGFGNSAADKSHYNSTYGNINYDNPAAIANNYYTSTNKDALHTSIAIDNDTGTLKLQAATGPDGGYYAWFDTVNGSYGSWPLNYNPKDAEIIQIRFKMEGFRLGTGRANPYFTIQYFNQAKDDVKHQVSQSAIPLNYLSNGEYMTATIPLTDSLGQTFRGQSAITKLRIFFGDIMCVSGTKGKITIDYLYIGPKNGFEDLNNVYGYDTSYDWNNGYSGNSSMFVMGSGVPLVGNKTDEEGRELLDADGNPLLAIQYAEGKTYTEVSFPFTGTGFDIISCTGKQQGSLRVMVCDSDGNVRKTVSVLNQGETKLFQIPVVSVTDLPYGSYTVHVFINAPYTSTLYPVLNRGGEFYFDAVRIYHTIDTQSTRGSSAYEVYQQHGEADPTFRELRDILIDANKGIPDATIDGVVYLDISGNTATNTLASYEAAGPNNEVYLAPGNALAFKLEVNGRIPASIHIGAKSADGSTVSMTTGVGAIVSDAKTGGFTRSIGTATAQFYPLNISSSLWQSSENTSYVYVMISNTGTKGILSITHIKYAYDVDLTYPTMETRSVRFTMDPTMLGRLLEPCEHEWDGGTVMEAATCTETGRVRYTCGLCDETFTAELPATGHAYLYGRVDTNCHKVTCENCAYLATELHVYTETECICGQMDPNLPVVEPNWKIGHTLNLSSDISVNLVVSKSALVGFDMDTVYVESVVDVYDGSAKIGEKSLRLYAVETGNYYYFTLSGMTAVQMNNSITSVLHGTKDGKEYYSPVDEYSIATYAYSQLNKEDISPRLKTLCADLLRYGAKAQIYKGYRTDALADSGMSDSHRSYLSDMENMIFGSINLSLGDVENAPITWVGKTLNLDSKVELKFIFNAENYSGRVEDLNLQVAYTDGKGEPKTVVVENPEVYNETRRYYSFTLDTLLAAELRSVVSVQIVVGDTPLSCTLQYSADTYGHNKTGTLGELCKALFAYSDSAKKYFND